VIRILSFVGIGFVALAALLAVATWVGVLVIERTYPQEGRSMAVRGGVLNVLDVGPRDAPGLPIVMIHGASSTLGTQRIPLGDELAKRHRVILIDRPGHGWSTRDDLERSSPADQARMIDEALGKLGIPRAIFVVHSLAGALGALMPLNHPDRVGGLVMLAPVTYPWTGGVGEYNRLMTWPVVGQVLARTITLPLGLVLIKPGVTAVFSPQVPPPGYIEATSSPLILRPRDFLANAWDLMTLKDAVAEQAPRYPQIKTPVTLIAGDVDSIVSTEIHARRFAREVPDAKLIVLPGVGHMVQNAAPEAVIREIEALQQKIAGAS
jgi:pimeloyl-ACP methyl ester carboxylesterase